jgi:hypothetical protein
MDILTRLGGFFSLAMDSQAFLGELVCFAPFWGRGNNREHFVHQTQYLLFRMQK